MRTWVALVAVLALGAATADAALETIGKAAAVRSETEGTPPGEPTRKLSGGDDAYHDERIETSDSGDAQFLFLDESTLTVGPSTEMVLDEFVYDPGQPNNRLSVELRRGVARFIGGRVSKDEGAQFQTPNATIAIRGGIGFVRVGEDQQGPFSQGVLLLGKMICRQGASVEVVTESGATCIIRDFIRVRALELAELQQILYSIRGTGAPLGKRIDDPGKIEQTMRLDCGSSFSSADAGCTPPYGGFAGPSPADLFQPGQYEKQVDFVNLQTAPMPPQVGVAPRLSDDPRLLICPALQ